MSLSRRMDSIRATPEGRRMIDRVRLCFEATEVLCRLMDSRGVTSAELARRLGVSPARVSQLLSGSRNLTLASIGEAFHVLGRSMHVAHGPLTERAIVNAKLVERARAGRRIGGSTRRKSETPGARGRRGRKPGG